jgi:hypothetical protein
MVLLSILGTPMTFIMQHLSHMPHDIIYNKKKKKKEIIIIIII